MMNSHVLSNLVEGYDESKAHHLEMQNETVSQEWLDIYSSRQNKTILQSVVVGVEDKMYSVSDKKKTLCAIVDVGDVKGLIPVDYLGVATREEARGLIGSKVVYTVIAIDKENEFFVGSRNEALSEMVKRTLRKLEVGDQTIAVVRKIYTNSMIVNVGGIETRIAAKDVSYGWIDSLHDKFKPDDHVNVKVKAIDKENKTLEVSIKETKPNPWNDVTRHLQQNGEYIAKVSGVTEFGTFVEIREGITGLAQHLRHEVVRKNDKVLIRVIKMFPKDERIVVKVVKVLS